MPGLSAAVCSRNGSNLAKCLEMLRHCEPGIRRIVVDDGVDWGQVRDELLAEPSFAIPGARPFVFARNSNLGIHAAGEDDVLLLNDDALVMTKGGITRMWQRLRSAYDLGIAAALTNVTGYPEQSIHRRPVAAAGDARMWVTPTVAFLDVLIPRRVINTVGLLDEGFVAYGGEDVDYCIRVRKAGMFVAVYDGCCVDHNTLPSSFRPHGGAGDITEGVRLLKEKWGDGIWTQ